MEGSESGTRGDELAEGEERCVGRSKGVRKRRGEDRHDESEEENQGSGEETVDCRTRTQVR